VFQVKICGVTTVDDARSAVDAGAGAIGLNFYDHSARCVGIEQGARIASAIGDRAVKVGVFVNCPAERIRDIATQCGLDIVQLHGDESPDHLAALGRLRVMRAFRVAGELASVRSYLEACAALDAMPELTLVDAAVPGQYGGSGKSADWDLLSNSRADLCALPWVLAGGLTPQNVALAIATTRPDAVDVASGVEEQPGRKSRELTRAFVRAALDAFAELSGRPTGG
jgi:phosphoribosylanthranilate isomerase